MKGEELLDLIESLSDHTYRDSTEVAIAIGKKSGRKKIRSAKEVESNKPPSKKGGNVAASLSISASTLAKTLSGINLPQSKENVRKYVSKNIAKMNRCTIRNIKNI